MLEGRILSAGTRVRVCGPTTALGVTLASPEGTVVGPAEWGGYYIVRLDQPARYQVADGHVEMLAELREYWDNLDVLAPRV